MNNKTDAEIEKILEYCEGEDGISYCNKCPLYEMDNCVQFMSRKSREIINRLKAENEDLFYKLSGVMLSVDKWLEGDELNQDEVQRAATMREKTLQITEQQQKEIERLKAVADAELAINALEKQIPKHFELWNGQCSCPNCNKLFGSYSQLKTLIHWEMPYCKFCGQALDWSDKE